MEKSFFIFGGYADFYSTAIARFDTTTRQWQYLGGMNEGRYGHGVIIQNGHFIVVGGDKGKKAGPLSTERCTLNGSSVRCTSVNPKLKNFFEYPELMTVTDNFCH